MGIFKHCVVQVLNACMDNPWQARCPFCWVEPKDVNNLDYDFTLRSEDAFSECCLSPLHFTINMFYHFCRVGARIKAKVRQFPAQGEVKQAKIKLAYERIMKKFDELGLHITKKRLADGNMARTAFQNLQFFSDTTGISVGLLHRFNIIRICLVSTLKKGCLYDLVFFHSV